MTIRNLILDPNAAVYTDDEIVGKINNAAVQITRAASVAAAARPIGTSEIEAANIVTGAMKANLDAMIDAARGYIKTSPVDGQFKIVSIERDSAGRLKVDYDDSIPDYADAYWVSPNGTATWANAKSQTPLSGSACCSLATGNANASPGDTVYFRAGTYSGITGSAIDPAKTGTAGNVITFSSYAGEDVQFVGSGLSCYAIDLDSDYGTVRNYIKLHDLHFTNFGRHLWIRRGSHNEISYCSCLGYPVGGNDTNLEWSASYIYRQATHNWVHHSTFGTFGCCVHTPDDYNTDYGVVFQVGLEEADGDGTQYNTVEDCHMYQGGHHVISLNGKFNVYRNIYAHNEPWYPIGAPLYGTRTMFQTGNVGDGCYNLTEKCRFGYGGPKNKDEIGGAGGTLSGQRNLWRQNIFLQVYTDGMFVTKYNTDVIYNKVYNNTFWHCGYGNYQENPGGTVPSPYWDDAYTHGMDIAEWGTDIHDNAFKNNLFYQNHDHYGTAYSIVSHVTHVAPVLQEMANNWLDNAGDPKFVDITGTPDPMNQTQFNFNLQASSPCIGAGTHLTHAVGAGVGSSTLVVLDALYFQDGAWGSDLSDVQPDWIAIGTVGNVVAISSINYATNTITLASAMTWADNAPVWWYKNSAGERVLYGSAPEIGAKPYVS